MRRVRAPSLDARMTQVEKRLNTVERVVSRTEWRRAAGPARHRPARRRSTSAAGTPASAPLADLQARIASVEGEVSGLTNRVETAEHRLQQLEADFAAYKKDTDARLKALEGSGAPRRRAGRRSTTARRRPSPTKPVVDDAQARARPAADPDRADRVAAVPKPTGADAPDKGTYAYNYGYRLWKASSIPRPRRSSRNMPRAFPSIAWSAARRTCSG